MISRRRATWLLRNLVATPFLAFRIPLFVLAKLGEGCEWLGLRTPGWREFDGWSGW